MTAFRRIYDNSDSESVSAAARRKRFDLFLRLQHDLPRPYKILDVGGTQRFWEVMGLDQTGDVEITLVNLRLPEVSLPNFKAIEGDACRLDAVSDGEFDVVFSNSVIEHVGDYARQQQMANEVLRVSKRHFVQTPNYYFPIEPHFLFPGFQWLPIETRARLLQRRKLGWVARTESYDDARAKVEQIRLLKKTELHALFPNSNVYQEKMLGMTKSFVVYGGWDKN